MRQLGALAFPAVHSFRLTPSWRGVQTTRQLVSKRPMRILIAGAGTIGLAKSRSRRPRHCGY